MEYKTAAQIRQLYLEFFEKQGHTQVPSASLVPAGDPSLLFTNSGMVPFKDTFLGKEPRAYKRAVSAQRCVRAGGKHNDLENVGYTARHHTFFEMLGNFSFGDYFKQQAIAYAWELVTEQIGLPADKLWVTVHHSDDEAAAIWHKEIGVPKERIRALDEDNFWQMGDTGPCGPCSEIFYDHGPEIAGDPPGGANDDGDRYIEIWNLVFMQFNRTGDGKMTPLPKPSVDTGMGLERIAAVLQGVHNNYDTDLFAPLLKLTAELCGLGQGGGQGGDKSGKAKNNQESNLASQRIIADHIRSAAFLIADGVNPSNEGRGYVLRRIIRRALRHGNKLKIDSPFFHKLVAPLAAEMGQAHPLINECQDRVVKTLKQEEERFNQTLEQGLALLHKEKAKISGGLLSGEVAFKLYDTYGFPPDLTEDIGREQGFRLDWDAFKHKMDEQRKRSRSYSMFQQQEYSLPADTPASKFVGYEENEAAAKTLLLLDGDGKPAAALQQGQEGVLVLDKTPFYAESGGQIGDQGQILSAQGSFAVLDTQKQDGIFLHFGKMEEGSLSTGSEVTARIDAARRAKIAEHHTATHLLHAALHLAVGEQAQQRGSRVADDSLRLDFACDEAMSRAQLEQVEDWVNARIRDGLEISTSYKSLAQAKQEGAMALFGEKYGDRVRVVDIPGASKELCGGNHCGDTGQIQEFILLRESSISAGVRRIEAVVGDRAKNKRHQQKAALNDIKLILGTTDELALAAKTAELVKKLDKQSKEVQQLQEELQFKDNLDQAQQKLADAPSYNGVPLIYLELDAAQPKVVNKLSDFCRQKADRALVVIANRAADKNGLLISINKELAAKYPANELMQLLLAKYQGSGGGNPSRAQGGLDKLDGLEREISDWLNAKG